MDESTSANSSEDQNFITLKIPKVTENDVLYGIAALAEFPKGSVFKKTSSFWPKINKYTFLAWHEDSTDPNGEFMAIRGPDIAVSQVHERKPDRPMFEPTDRYRVMISEKVNPEVFGMLEERIREEYRKTSFLRNLFRRFQKNL